MNNPILNKDLIFYSYKKLVLFLDALFLTFMYKLILTFSEFVIQFVLLLGAVDARPAGLRAGRFPVRLALGAGVAPGVPAQHPPRLLTLAAGHGALRPRERIFCQFPADKPSPKKKQETKLNAHP